MPATKFQCPNGNNVKIEDCLNHCPQGERCMFLPTLRAIAKSVDRKLTEPTVTELLSGTRETYLKKTTDFSVAPAEQLFALHGSAFHNVNQANSEGNILTEVRLYNGVMSGQFDVYGEILDENSHTLGDYKVTSSYKLMKALGYYKVDIPTGEVYKTGARKGQEKTRKEWRTDGVKDILDWAIQLNYYRMLLEARGFKVEKMQIQALVRDYSTRIATERNITKPVYIIPINRISDRWLKLYFDAKAKKLQNAIDTKTLPPPCKGHENWQGRKCLDYCDVANQCPYGMVLKEKADTIAA